MKINMKPFPYLQRFLYGSLQANCGGLEPQEVGYENFPFTEVEFGIAEKELADFCVGNLEFAYWLGTMADEGYTVHMPASASEDGVTQDPMLAFEILDTFY